MLPPSGKPQVQTHLRPLIGHSAIFRALSVCNGREVNPKIQAALSYLVVVGQNDGPTKNAHVLNPGTREYVTYTARGTLQMSLRILRWVVSLDYQVGPV